MIVDLDEIGREEPAGTVLAFAETVESGAEISFAQQVEGEIRFTRAGETVWVDGTVGTTVTLTCGRCLRSFPHRLGGAFHEGFRTAATGATRRPRDGGDLILTLEGSTLDVTEVVRQHLLMALPMVPLCRSACRGLCPVCGADRNEIACGCAGEEIDPRLATLRGFRPASG